MPRRGQRLRKRSSLEGMCVETRGREILADIVHGEIDKAMRIGRFDEGLSEHGVDKRRLADGIRVPAVKTPRLNRVG